MGVLTSFLFLLGLGITVSTVVDLQKRVIGGRDCRPNERLYHVKITDVFGQLVCGGSLISDWWILTSAHCWKWAIRVVIGVHPGPGQTLTIRQPPLIYKENNTFHDIMLLKLPQRVLIPPVRLPPLNCRRPNTSVQVETAGYASTTTGPNHLRERNEAVVLLCANITVNGTTVITLKTLQRAHVFYGRSPTVDVSHGDSGGGVVIGDMIYGLNTGIRNGTHALVDVDYFLDVCHYRRWIVDTMANYYMSIKWNVLPFNRPFTVNQQPVFFPCFL